jgi:hypothetical protein
MIGAALEGSLTWAPPLQDGLAPAGRRDSCRSSTAVPVMSDAGNVPGSVSAPAPHPVAGAAPQGAASGSSQPFADASAPSIS